MTKFLDLQMLILLGGQERTEASSATRSPRPGCD
jgi:hypothetical protein